jgi:malate dehydrogenase (oxaloacetate-decarboxylating)(NADP+)
MAILAAEEVRRFGVAPKVALLSHSNFGSGKSTSARKMAAAREILIARAPDLEIDGEMHGDSALSETIRALANPESTLTGEANVLIMPNIDAANISYNLLKMTGGDGVTIGPILLGAAKPVHVLTSTATVRRVVNLTAVSVVDSAASK